ncbi:unnamed protein product [Euphydryas editha]|uniref:PiggyBac transposable element-derived protein domain-containing protein n=1 Tax=Euphydryas editha TaxID=104508 RepID=A0AAU9V817_EUPED|nr:unnamed protein product [Euphydryas editha]
MNRKRCNTSPEPSTSRKMQHVPVNCNISDEFIESLLCESEESSADEEDCIQSDCGNSSSEEDKENEEPVLPTPAASYLSESSNDDIPLSSLVSRANSQERETSRQVNEPETVVSSDEPRHKKYFYGKRRCMKWSAEGPSRTTRTPAHNIVVPSTATDFPPDSSSSQLFGLLISESIKNKIISFTNQRLEMTREKYKRRNKPELKNIDALELDAFIGLLIFSAVFKSNDEDINALFATDGTGRDIFRAVMSKERFAMILLSLRFDDASTRDQRKQTDVATAISDIFSEFIANCQKYYKIEETTTIDEMLVSFRGRCRWKKYMPNKPCKYGLEIKCLTDSATGYLYNAYLYTGKNSDGNGLTEEEKKLLVPTQCVLRLAKPIMRTNRNITADNYFSSIEVCLELKKNGLTYVGTLKKNKREIPPEFLDKKREVHSTMYGFTKELTLLSYVPKKKKTVQMISSMHHEESIDSTKSIPEIISFYNATKGGVDSLDEKCAKYTCARRSRRWPLVIFFRILDVAAANTFIISNYNSTKRMEFMKDLGRRLVTPQLERRYAIPQLSHELKSLMGRILGKDNYRIKPTKH